MGKRLAKLGAAATGLMTMTCIGTCMGGPVVAGASVAGASAAAGGAVASAPMQRVGALGSSNWSGYVVQGGTGAFHAATARWTVPAVSASSGPTYSASWVGIDGFSNSNLIQTGTESDYYNGSAHYDAWWEILPAAESPVFAVRPGDVMTASIKKGTGGWTIKISDQTSGRSFTSTKSYGGPGTSVEWIQERPQVNGNLATLAKYGKVTFDPGTANGANPHLKAGGRILMLNNAGTAVISNPSSPDSDTDGFAVKYGSTAPAPPAS